MFHPSRNIRTSSPQSNAILNAPRINRTVRQSWAFNPKNGKPSEVIITYPTMEKNHVR